MSRPCEKMQKRIVDLALGILSGIESQVVRDHIEGCDRCRQFHHSLRRQQDALQALGRQLDDRIQVGQERTISILQSTPANSLPGRPSIVRRVLWSRKLCDGRQGL